MINLNALSGSGGFATGKIRKQISIIAASKHKVAYTDRFASVSAMLTVNLYPASSRLKPSTSSPMYLNLAQSRKFVRVPADHDEHFNISFSKSLQALPHRNSGMLSAEKSTSVMFLTGSLSEAKTPPKAPSSSKRSCTRCWCDWKLRTVSYSVILDWKAKVTSVKSPEAKPPSCGSIRREVLGKVDRWKFDGCQIRLSHSMRLGRLEDDETGRFDNELPEVLDRPETSSPIIATGQT